MDSAIKKYTYHRSIGYIFTLIVHICNMIYLRTTVRAVVEKEWDDKRVKSFSELQGRYFTGWTVVVQILHAITGLMCELLVLWNFKKKNYQLPSYLRGFRNTLYCGVLWPSTMLVSSMFWSLYSYDRGLIFPEFVDKILTVTTNHILHSLIVPIALWELWYQPRVKPRSHKKYIGHMTFHMLLYLSVLLYTYTTKGVWIYPVFKTLQGTIYFPLIFISITIFLFIAYYIQWLLVWMVWGNFEKKGKKSK